MICILTKSLPFSALRKTWPDGGAKKPFFRFATVSIGGTDKAGKMSAFFISGTCALTVIADKEEIKEASTETEDLFRGVRKMKLLFAQKRMQVRTSNLLKWVSTRVSSQRFLEIPSGASSPKDPVIFWEKAWLTARNYWEQEVILMLQTTNNGLKSTTKFRCLSLGDKGSSLQTKIFPYVTACGEQFYTKSLGTFVRSSWKIQSLCE